MDSRQLEELLFKVQSGSISPDQAMRQVRFNPVKELGFAVCDTNRQLRQGFPETIFAEGKTANQIISIANELLDSSPFVLATRVSAQLAQSLGEATLPFEYYSKARVGVFGEKKIVSSANNPISVTVISAGTSDLPVAEEACVILEHSSVAVSRVYDVGVAGLHRLLGKLDVILNTDVVIVVAGMDGALPSVIGGIVACPVVAVPTSIGYGANFEGMSALLAMLNSCAAGLTVVNIDNGFGAAMAALRLTETIRSKNLSLVTK